MLALSRIALASALMAVTAFAEEAKPAAKESPSTEKAGAQKTPAPTPGAADKAKQTKAPPPKNPIYDRPPPPPPLWSPRDAQIEKVVRDVSASNIEVSIRKLGSFKTRHTLSSATDANFGIGAARNWIKAELERASRESGGRLTVAFDSFRAAPKPPRLPEGAEIVNVVATLPGKQPAAQDRILVVMAHYDSRVTAPLDSAATAPGADKNASGTAAVIELARVMAKYEFDATIVFLAVGAGEQNSEGAEHWAAQAKQKGLNLVAVLNNDSIGNAKHEDGSRDRTGVRLFADGVPLPVGSSREWSEEVLAQLRAGGENDFPTRQLARLVQQIGAKYAPLTPVNVVYRRDRLQRGGDQEAFLDQGFSAVRFNEVAEAFDRFHQNVREINGVKTGDLADHVDFTYVAEVARVNAAVLAELASAPAAPKGFEIDAAKPENDTTLRWEANTDPDLAGYRLVWRETSAPQWEHDMELKKDVTRQTVKGVSRDTTIFGLQAMDTGGHGSVIVTPKPLRATAP